MKIFSQLRNCGGFELLQSSDLDVENIISDNVTTGIYFDSMAVSLNIVFASMFTEVCLKCKAVIPNSDLCP